MDIDRKRDQGGYEVAIDRLHYCLTMFEKDKRKAHEIFGKDIIKGVTVEEVIGAMVAAEQELLKLKDEVYI